MRRWARILLGVVVAVGVVNFVAFVVIAENLGGDALNGKVEDGRYYLMRHGVYTEVTCAVWTYSNIHAISAIALHPGVFAVAQVLFLTGRRLARHLTRRCSGPAGTLPAES
jgi:hypothetical protein